MNLQTRVEHDVPSSNGTIRIQIGEVCCAVRCHDQEMLCKLQQLYGDFTSDQRADISLELKHINKMGVTEFEAALPDMEFFHDGDRFGATDLIIKGERNLDAGTVVMEVERHFLDSDAARGFVNHALCLVYHTGCKVRYNGNPPAFIVHSCGIIRHGQVLLFAGPSGIGKTTIARLCGDEYGQVLNDEALLIHKPHEDNDFLMAQGIPIMGELPQRLNVTAPLRVVLLLKQSKQTSVRRLNRMDAYIRFIRQIIRPAYFGQRDKREVYSLMTKFCAEVCRTTPFYELEFTLDRESLWETVGELEALLDKEGN